MEKLQDFEKHDLIKRVWKPSHEFKFHQYVEHGRHWRISSKYLDDRSTSFLPWLVYSAFYDGAFCLPCVAFGKSIGTHNYASQLISEPFTRLNGAPSRWAKHERSEHHKTAVAVLQSFLGSWDKQHRRIDNIIDAKRKDTIMKKKLLPIIKIVVLCGRQNIALRGHRDNSAHKSEVGKNPGNFQALLDFRMDSGDDVLREHFRTAPKNATYRSKTIQNEIIASCGKFIRQNISGEVRSSKFYTIMADEASDASHTEQLSLCVRSVDRESQVREKFVEFIGCKSVNAKSLVTYIKDALEKLGLPLRYLRGQSYDSAGCMAGPNSGVSTRILKECPLAFYFHCSSHRLTVLYPGFLGFVYTRGGGGFFAFLPAAHNSRMAYTRIMKFGMEIVLNKGSWKIILKMRLLPWLHIDVISKCAIGPKQYINCMSCISRG